MLGKIPIFSGSSALSSNSLYLIHLRVVRMVMASVHWVQWVVLVVVVLVVMEAGLRAERLLVGGGGRVGVGHGGLS